MIMPKNVVPLVDEKNPFYCPAIPASAYLKSLRNRVQRIGNHVPHDLDISLSFSKGLDGLSHEHDMDSEGHKTIGSDWILGDYFSSGKGWFSSPSPGPEDLPPYSPIAHVCLTKAQNQTQIGTVYGNRDDLKRKNDFSDFGAPPKYARSAQSFHESSFDLEVRREKLDFSLAGTPAPASRGRGLVLPVILDDNNATFIVQLDAIMPGIRLKDRLSGFIDGTPQDLMDYLCQHGFINKRTLAIFRYSSVQRITFAPSMLDENGLNLVGSNIYSVFNKYENFRSLHELSFAGISIRHSDILHIHHLPCLTDLNLNETGIGNEGVFLLVSLKSTLTRLSLAMNPDINNDVVPAIIILDRLCFLSILDTGIDMVGLRRLAQHMDESEQIMDIEIPFACEAYVDDVNTKYLVDIKPPYISNPRICGQLTSTALQRNLEAHAACNPSIVASGTRAEMLKRLSDILTTRRLDMLVMSMLEGNEISFRKG